MTRKPPTPPNAASRTELMAGIRRVVVKVGTNVLTRHDGEMAMGRFHSLIEDIVELHRRGLQIIVVSSGAISMGMHRLGIQTKPSDLPALQACAAVGQIRLMSTYEQAFERWGVSMAQVLLTEDDLANRARYLNLRNTLEHLLGERVIPVVNENDTVSTSEIQSPTNLRGARGVFGDNDRLSAQVMSKLNAELLILLTDVEGLYRNYTEDAESSGDAHSGPLSVVEEINAEIESMASFGKHRGRGGMSSKLDSIRIALASGGLAVIASGHRPGVVARVLAGDEVGTLFLPKQRLTSRKRWLAYASIPTGRVTVNRGAEEALTARASSLLFAGVVSIEGSFREGEIVTLATGGGEEIGRGVANYDAAAAQSLVGKTSEEVSTESGRDVVEFIHRDNLVIYDDR